MVKDASHSDPVPDLAHMRVDYGVPGPEALGDEYQCPWDMWSAWWKDASSHPDLLEPNAMSLATASRQGVPSVRTVLLKSADRQGWVWYTNLASRKSAQVTSTGWAAAVLAWLPLHRQVSVIGPVELIPRMEVEQYFQSRPWASRIGAWASMQSQPVENRAEVEQRFADFSALYPDTGSAHDVPVPDHWGGWRLRPVEMEFWSGHSGRLHHRVVFRTGESFNDAELWSSTQGDAVE